MIFDPLYSSYLYQLSQPQEILCCQIPSVATKGEQLQIKHSHFSDKIFSDKILQIKYSH